ncbi:MAG: NAD(+) kinase [Pseudomonadota bacterium]
MGMVFKSIGIIAKQDDELVYETVRSLYEYLSAKKIKICVDKNAQECLDKNSIHCIDIADMHNEIDLALVVGGDGTLLSAAQSMVPFDVPIVGINRGRLGFLTDILPENMHQNLDQILQGTYFKEVRTVLSARLIRDKADLAQCLAINDIVVHARYVVRMIELETRVADEHLNALRADGLIVSTPTGSTAYALSGGGPIMHPSSATTLLVPICPHTLSNRPIVVDENCKIEIIYSEQNEVNGIAAVDGQMEHEMIPGDRIVIEKSDRPLILIQPKGYSYFKVLRKKLNWSKQP